MALTGIALPVFDIAVLYAIRALAVIIIPCTVAARLTKRKTAS